MQVWDLPLGKRLAPRHDTLRCLPCLQAVPALLWKILALIKLILLNQVNNNPNHILPNPTKIVHQQQMDNKIQQVTQSIVAEPITELTLAKVQNKNNCLLSYSDPDTRTQESTRCLKDNELSKSDLDYASTSLDLRCFSTISEYCLDESNLRNSWGT